MFGVRIAIKSENLSELKYSACCFSKPGDCTFAQVWQTRLISRSCNVTNTKHAKVQSTKSTFAGAHIYTNYSNLSKLLSQNTKLSKSDEKWISRWANWAELDLESSDNNLTLSGFTLVEDSSSNYLTSLFGQLEQKIEISKVAPRNTYKITALGIEDFNLFYANYKDFLAKHNNLYEHNKALSDIKSKYNSIIYR